MVFCEICKVNTACMKSHILSKKHLNGGVSVGMTTEQLKEYHKKYYVDKNLKERYKEKKKCEVCDKMVAKYNWSKHIQTEKHFKKEHAKNNPEEPYVRDRTHKIVDNTNKDKDEYEYKEVEIIDPLTVKEEDTESVNIDEVEKYNNEFIALKNKLLNLPTPIVSVDKELLPPKKSSRQYSLKKLKNKK